MPYAPVENPQPWMKPLPSTPDDVVAIETWAQEQYYKRRKPVPIDAIRLLGGDHEGHHRFYVAVWNSNIEVKRGVILLPWQYRIVPPDLRREVLAVGKCRFCGSKERLSVDHIIPVIRGGRTERSNLQCLCLPCNIKKGARPNGVVRKLIKAHVA